MNKNILIKNIKTPVSRKEIVEKYCFGKEVLDIGCVNHNIDNVNESSTWLHGKIKKVAKSLMGVDYLPEEVEFMKSHGYNVVCADICKPLLLNRTFDVIVVGNLIEHISNFEGLLLNLANLLKKDGVVLISTANPFYIEQYFYSAFRNDIIVNEEHTCWIDPVTLDELIRRYGFKTDSVYWIEEKWRLHWVVMNSKRYVYNVMTGNWSFGKKKNVLENIIINTVKPIYKYIFSKKYNRFIESYSYSDDPDRFIVLRLLSRLFSIYWSILKLFIPTSAINAYELYFSSIQFNSASFNGSTY